jgi:hypothetical protein
METIMIDTVWNRARANNGCGLDDALFERAVMRCGWQVNRDRFGEPQRIYFPEPPEGNDWHEVCWIEDDEGNPAVLWRRLKVPHEIVP